MTVNTATTTVLFIDPHDEDRRYWTQRLLICSFDYTILEAKEGHAGLELYRSRPIDCVVLELGLADMSGSKVLINLIPRVRYPDVAVIVLTRLLLAPMRQFLLQNGAQAYLVKSQISGDDLHRSIQKAIAVVGASRKERRS
jgi:DNA-binding NarL/FixJ family response regulator